VALSIDGAVENPLSLTLVDLMGYPATTHMATLECYSSSIELIGNANWTGVSLTQII
jgi:DMSO/TMAO reductase YedYZ molybdopterin-dependent catalytic subunit